MRHTLDGMLVAADVIVVSQKKAGEWRDVYGTVIHAALDEGRELAALAAAEVHSASGRPMGLAWSELGDCGELALDLAVYCALEAHE